MSTNCHPSPTILNHLGGTEGPTSKRRRESNRSCL